jgi:L-threonylcarbamoyladenylate synthase
MEIIKLYDSGMDYAIQRASEVLSKGGIIAYPTETIYGLGALYNLQKAIKRLLKLKGRGEEKGIILIAGSIDFLRLVVEEIPQELLGLIKEFWPGPLTILFKARSNLNNLITGSTGKVAVRVPGESFALEFLKRTGFIISSTSANPSGKPPAEDVPAILKYFPEGIDLLIDGGRLTGMPSTIIDVTDKKIKVIREGAVSIEKLKEIASQKGLKIET